MTRRNAASDSRQPAQLARHHADVVERLRARRDRAPAAARTPRSASAGRSSSPSVAPRLPHAAPNAGSRSAAAWNDRAASSMSSSRSHTLPRSKCAAAQSGAERDRLVEIARRALEVVHLLTHAGRGHQRRGGAAVRQRLDRSRSRSAGSASRNARASMPGTDSGSSAAPRRADAPSDATSHLHPREDAAALQDVLGMAADDGVIGAGDQPCLAVRRRARAAHSVNEVLRLRRDEPRVRGLPLLEGAIGAARPGPPPGPPASGGTSGCRTASARPAAAATTVRAAMRVRHPARFGVRGVAALVVVADDERHAGMLNRRHSFTIGQETSPDGLVTTK